MDLQEKERDRWEGRNLQGIASGKGYTQKEGFDYEETFSSVAMIKSIRILLSIAAHMDYKIWQMNVNTAFLNGILEEIIYMVQPEGFIAKGQEKKVCKLQKSIYGFK